MTAESTPPDGHVLREVPELNVALEGEVTPLVAFEPPDPLEERTPVVDSAPPEAEATDPVGGGVPYGVQGEALRLPRTGLEELDTALDDLERALRRMSVQDRRLLWVVACAFISLFVPWFRAEYHGPKLPTTAISGLELAGLSCLVLIVTLAFVLLARTWVDAHLKAYRRLVVRCLAGALALRMVWALIGTPAGDIPWRYSVWSMLPALLSVGLVMGILGRLPAFPRRPLPPP